MGILKFLKKKERKSRFDSIVERYERLQTLPKVSEDPYELPAERLFPPPEPQPTPEPEPTQGEEISIRFCMSRPSEKMRVSFVTTDQTLDKMLMLCKRLDTQRSDVIRASLEMAMPVFENHPEMFNYFAHRARWDW